MNPQHAPVNLVRSRFGFTRKGQALAEYGAIGAIIGVGAIIILITIGGNLNEFLSGVANAITAAFS